MGLSVKTGSFLTNTVTGNQSITGIGFQGKFAIFFGSQKPDAQGESNGSDHFFGVAVSTTKRWAVSGQSFWGFNPSDTYNAFNNDSCITMADFGSAYVVRADFVSWDSDGFTVNITDADGTTRRIFYIILGGTDLSVDCGTFNMNGTTGNQAVTAVGFLPDFSGFANCRTGTTSGISANSRTTLGFAISSTTRAMLAGYDEDGVAASSDTYSQQITTKCGRRLTNTGAVDQDMDFVSNDSGGFTVNVTTSTVSTVWGYFCLKGAQFKIGTFSENTSTGNQAVTGVGFQPDMLMFLSISRASNAAVIDNFNLMLGTGYSSTDRRCTDTDAQDAAAGSSKAQKKTSESLCIIHCAAAGSSGNPSNQAEADFVSKDSDGFTINMSLADATSRENVYLAIAQTPVGGADAVPQCLQQYRTRRG